MRFINGMNKLLVHFPVCDLLTVGIKTLFRQSIFRPKIVIDHRCQIFIDSTSHNGNPGLVAL